MFKSMFRFVSTALVTQIVTIACAFAEGPATPAGATAAAAAPGAAGGPVPPPVSPMMQFLPFIAMFGVIYFLMIKPQQKKMKEQQTLLGSLKHGDEIITSSGILGKVTDVADTVVTVEVATGVRVKMMKAQVTQIVKGQSA